MNGILNINKPRGVTSFSVVAAVKKCSGEPRVGHAGTLDPMASGVLPVCLGHATRVVEFLMDNPKTYRADIELGVTTDTLDAEGNISAHIDASRITLSQIESALESFQGIIEQIPPIYSALKYRGKPLYKWAREGKPVKSGSRRVMIYKLELEDFQNPVLTVKVTCGKGTYIRSLADDLGKKLGCGGSLKSLVRLNYGPFNLNDSVLLEQVESAFQKGRGQELLLPPDTALNRWPAVILSESDTKSVICGKSIGLLKDKLIIINSSFCRAYSAGGCFLAVLRYEPAADNWHPDKVFL